MRCLAGSNFAFFARLRPKIHPAAQRPPKLVALACWFQSVPGVSTNCPESVQKGPQDLWSFGAQIEKSESQRLEIAARLEIAERQRNRKP